MNDSKKLKKKLYSLPSIGSSSYVDVEKRKWSSLTYNSFESSISRNSIISEKNRRLSCCFNEQHAKRKHSSSSRKDSHKKELVNQQLQNENVDYDYDDGRFQEDLTYKPYINQTILHQHVHKNYKKPHMHNNECNRILSAYDLDRSKRYYFTSQITPVRVYVNYYEKKQITASSMFAKEYSEFKLDNLHAKKLNVNLLQYQLGVSKKFLKEASNLIFNKYSMSFTPFIIPNTNTHDKNRVETPTKLNPHQDTNQTNILLTQMKSIKGVMFSDENNQQLNKTDCKDNKN